MAKAKKDDKKEQSKISEYIQHMYTIFEALKKGLSNLTKNIQKAIYHTEKKVMQVFFCFSVFLLGIIFTSIAIILLIPELTGIHIGWSFLGIGILLIVWAYFIKVNFQKTKHEVQ